MKIILSRKGFDSAAGGYPSPILPNGTLLSLPIPDDSTGITYSGLEIGRTTYFDIMDQLKPGKLNLENNKLIFDKSTTCHLDPDIRKNIMNRPNNWKGLFGQIGAAQTHLKNNKVSVGDIFLYFGWFRRTININGRLRFDPSDKNGRHIIYGYLEIGNIISVKSETDFKKWMSYHPHTLNRRIGNQDNTLYIASDHLSLDERFKGYGVFKFNENYVLSKSGETRSKWQLPNIFKEVTISYHTKMNWKDRYFQSAARGQEFVISEKEEVTNWAKKLIKANSE